MTAGSGEVEGVFCVTVNSRPLQRANVIQRLFNLLMAQDYVPTIRFHDLRQTAVTLLPSQGGHAKVVQVRLRHLQISLP
jgi:hypothetical protein